jgi:alpha-tubulin suppressor-like RCC1 family protein
MAACAVDSDDHGSAVVGVATGALSASDVTRVTVAVTGAGITSPIVRKLVKVKGQWTGVIGKIPAGGGRTFKAEAYDAQDTLLYTGEAPGVTIAPGPPVLVHILLQQADPPALFQNSVPVIESLVASAAAVPPGAEVALKVAAHDPDPGDALAYAWSAGAGSFDEPASATTTWTAPQGEGPVTVTVSVTDSKTSTQSLSVVIDVASSHAKGAAKVEVSLNTWPVVTGLVASPAQVAASGTTSLTLTVVDPDGDPLAFAWSDGCAGSFGDASAQNPSWTAPASAPPSGACTLTVAVDDGRGGATTAALTIQVGPSVVVNIAPVITGTFQSSMTVAPGAAVLLGATAMDPEGQPLSFAWSSPTGALGTPTTTPTASDVAWTAPAVGSVCDHTVTVEVSDNAGGATSHAFSIATCGGSANTAPVADAGPDQKVSTGAVVTLDGSGSSDADGDPLTYSWSLASAPGGSAAALSDPTAASPTFIADLEGTYVVSLVVNDGSVDSPADTVQIEAQTGVSALAAGYNHSLAVRTDGTVWAWGDNGFGQLGTGATGSYTKSPVQVSGLTSATAVSGGYHSLAVRSDGTAWAWGYNYYGSLGDGTTTNRNTPVQVTGLSGVVAVAGGQEYSLALRTDGTVWAWGRNTFGQLGDGSTTNRSTPVQVTGLSSVVSVEAGNASSFAVRSDGTVWAWGHNTYGTLGDGSTTNRKIPVQVTGLSNVASVTAREAHVLAVRSDGTLWAWGWNGHGQLGDGTTTDRHSPVQVTGLTGVVGAAAGVYHSLAVRSDGTLRAWGWNHYGQLGDGTSMDRHTPVQVVGLTSAALVVAGYNHSLALTTTGTAWGWGNGTVGQVGCGSQGDFQTPVQVAWP